MRRVLVLTEDYPNNNGGVALMYVHTRNRYYVEHGIDVTVLNFRAKWGYVYDSIKVIALNEYADSEDKYDVLVLHAANLKHHFVFLQKYGKRFLRFVFYYHGHEVLRINKSYSKPYAYMQNQSKYAALQDVYDTVKLFVWRKYLPSICHKSDFVFVSKWMFDEFIRWTGIELSMIQDKCSIVYNCVGRAFEEGVYDPAGEKIYDFVTIRGNLDGSKYSLDIVNRLAYHTPDRKFLVVGKGNFFDHYPKAPNLEWRNQTMTHEEILEVLQQSRFALMPTRTDAQGLMMCEMAAFGIPVITSDIPVCREVFGDFENVYLIDNDNEELSLNTMDGLKSTCVKDTRYYKEVTISKEVRIILDEREIG